MVSSNTRKQLNAIRQTLGDKIANRLTKGNGSIQGGMATQPKMTAETPSHQMAPPETATEETTTTQHSPPNPIGTRIDSGNPDDNAHPAAKNQRATQSNNPTNREFKVSAPNDRTEITLLPGSNQETIQEKAPSGQATTQETRNTVQHITQGATTAKPPNKDVATNASSPIVSQKASRASNDGHVKSDDPIISEHFVAHTTLQDKGMTQPTDLGTNANIHTPPSRATTQKLGQGATHTSGNDTSPTVQEADRRDVTKV